MASFRDQRTPLSFERYGVAIPKILLPAPEVDLTKWATVACDQFTAEPAYWRQVEAIVGDAPSTYRVMLPEAFLDESGESAAPAIHATMDNYRDKGVLREAVRGFVLVERAVSAGNRLGLVLAVDLERYDFSREARSLIRPTEGTIVERLPPRVHIRQGAPLELPHVMLLVDDPRRLLIEPLYDRRDSLRPLYDVELMQGGGRLRGWAVEEPAQWAETAAALETLHAHADGLLFAVGDGNHSLATARQCWLAQREGLTQEQREGHPARFALVEVVNLHESALVFEPIHRVLFHVPPQEVSDAWAAYVHARHLAEECAAPPAGQPGCTLVSAKGSGHWRLAGSQGMLAAAVAQDFLNGFLAAHPGVGIDYVHGEDSVRALCRASDTVGFLLPAMDKAELFPAVRAGGVLPRKTFSMGEAREKRYYMECREIEQTEKEASM